jgi:signal transduction histidine kinase
MAYLLMGPLPEEREAFDQFVTPGIVRSLQLAASANVLLVALWWLLDPIFFGGDAHALRQYTVLRLGTMAIQSAIALGVTFVPAVRRRPMPWAVPLLWANAVLIGWFVAGMGGPETPWFHFVYVTAFFGIPAPLRVGERFAATVAGAAAVIGGYLWARADYARAHFFAVAVSYYAWAVVTATVLGQMSFRHSVENFRTAQTFARFNAKLEERVLEQTSALQALAAHLDRAREADRAYIARELHDELGQELTALRYAVSLAQRRWERDPSSLAPSLAQIATLVNRTADATRVLVRELRPRLLLEIGLAQALEWLTTRVDTPDGLRAAFECEGALPEVDPEVAATAFRVVQEALTNAIRHAEASRVTVRAVATEGGMTVTVRDDGCGFDPATLRGQAGLGLVGMRERVRAVGGAFAVTSEPGRGTTVRADLHATAPVEAR